MALSNKQPATAGKQRQPSQRAGKKTLPTVNKMEGNGGEKKTRRSALTLSTLSRA